MGFSWGLGVRGGRLEGEYKILDRGFFFCVYSLGFLVGKSREKMFYLTYYNSREGKSISCSKLMTVLLSIIKNSILFYRHRFSNMIFFLIIIKTHTKQ